jgi:cytochrome P450
MRADETDRMDSRVPAEPVVEYDPFSHEVQEDPYPVYAWMREYAPLYHNTERNFWALSRYADVLGALRDPVRFTNRNGISLEPSLWGPQAYKNVFFLALDPPDHGVLRGLVAKDFTPRHVALREERIRELTRRRLNPLLEHDYFDFAADYAAAVPNDVVCEMLGIPSADWDLIRADTDLLTKREDESDERSAATLAAAFRLATYYVHLVANIRRHPSDNLTSILTQAEVDGKSITDSEIVAFLFLIVSGGNESTGKLIGNAWYHGFRLPDVQRAGLDGRFDDWASETLRFDSSSQMTSRTLTKDTEIHNTRLPAGERVVLLHASGNRDHRVFTDPDRFDIDRDTRKMISFGAGPHHCLGGGLAKLEIRIVLEEIAAEVCEYEIDMSSAKRVHSAHQRGFASLPCTVVRRGKRRPTTA